MAALVDENSTKKSSGSLAQHLVQHQRAVHLGAEHPLDLRLALGGDQAVVQHAGGVDHPVQRPEPLLHLGHDLRHAVGVGHVAGGDHHLGAGRLQLLHHPDAGGGRDRWGCGWRSGAHLRPVGQRRAGHQHQAGLQLAGHQPGHGGADAAQAAGDHVDAARRAAPARRRRRPARGTRVRSCRSIQRPSGAAGPPRRCCAGSRSSASSAGNCAASSGGSRLAAAGRCLPVVPLRNRQRPGQLLDQIGSRAPDGLRPWSGAGPAPRRGSAPSGRRTAGRSMLLQVTPGISRGMHLHRAPAPWPCRGRPAARCPPSACPALTTLRCSGRG